MLYMFNKVYLKPATHYARSNDSIIISDVTSELPTDLSEVALLEQDFGTIHYHAATYSELLNQFNGSEAAFFDWLVNFDHTKRLTVYVNDDDLLLIACKWYKALFRHMSVDQAHKLMTLVYAWYEYVFGLPYNPQVMLTSDDAARYRSLGAKLPTLSEFTTLWNNTTTFSLTTKGYDFFANSAPVEFQLATVYADPTTPITPAVKQKVVTMIQKFHIRFVIDLKHMILQRLDVLPGYDLATQTLADWVALNPQYQFLVDDNFLPDQYQYIADTYDLTALRTTYDQLIVLVGYEFHPDTMNAMLFLSPTVTFDEIMNAELAYKVNRLQVGRWEYQNVINTYVLEHVLNLIRHQDEATLTEWSVL